MNVLLLGSGGREHALAWKLAQSPLLTTLYIAPGNAGTRTCGINLSLDPLDFPAVAAAVQTYGIGLVVVGPEQPLVAGIADYLTPLGIPVIGPSASGARLEGSKSFSKAFMQRHGIPTAAYASFTADQAAEAHAYLASHPLPVVVKASGLAAGKGVLICDTIAEAQAAVADMLSGTAFGAAGETVVIESFLMGIEISVFVLTDGQDYLILPGAKDYKRVGEGDTGLNTGGMGAVSPVPFADEAFMARVEQEVIQPTIAGLAAEQIDYKGFIFIGLMVAPDGTPYVLEYNARMGDPETEVIIPRIQSDLLALFMALVRGELSTQPLATDPRTCTTVMLVSGGYPGTYTKGKPISNLEALHGVTVFHAGTREQDGVIYTDGGRVLAVTALGDSIDEAVGLSLAAADEIRFEGKYYRRDIGQDLIKLGQ
ncbi:MAG: phosphoribosylamine--glycine ligase [Bacteroidia bacterium]|nr:phosphoribosylamine--glycine ligase [Bacteroidia bacterium]